MTTRQASLQSTAWLPGLNFFLADVRDGLGPFLGVFLMGRGWQADDIGYVMTIGGIAGMLATTPLGALIDASRSKRLLLALGAVFVIVGTLVLFISSTFVVTAASQIDTGIVGAIIGPALAGVTLGLVGQERLAHQLGINEAWNHAGNMVSAALAGLLGYYWGLPAVFILMALMAAGSLVCISKIRPQDIDHDVACGLEPGGNTAFDSSALKVLARSAPLLLLAITMMLFHLGNAAMLPLLGQAIVSQGLADPSAFTAMTIIIAQLVMIPVALLAGRSAVRYGYWVLVMAAIMVLPVRGLIAGYWNSPWALIPVQFLDGIGAGILGVALPGLVAQLLRGSGHINIGLGAVTTIQGLGAALSPALAGAIAHRYSYSMAFIVLSAISSIALFVWFFARELFANHESINLR
ncbi:MFS transporter [Herbaspirillum sp. meg3]|uniref:MFS transporter n=1 Tax=Herbaspirillum sp. meg3 TaxID=2025949 RepID=UPI000B98CC70|nr:MFS transporter [Herbaspirillum sp. meg3]ASU37134.1 MFS transporter [Herbaspirillum sp. meg3]